MSRAFRRLSVLAATFMMLGASVPPAAAQSDILLQLRSGSPAGDRVRVDSAGGFVAMGTLGNGIIPASGCGERMMWYPFKGAFRAGSTRDGTACDHWNDDNVGYYSWAGGFRTRATGNYSFAFGQSTVASAQHAFAFGHLSEATHTHSFAAGNRAKCSGSACTSMGHFTNATGEGSVALGFLSTANANWSVAIGYRASTNARSGAFVISDASTSDSTMASANNQFSGRFAGGWRLFTNATMTAGVTLAAGGSSWVVVSDRNRKERFAPIDGEDVLLRLRSVPVTSWNYIAEGRAVRHIGPMAQDWHAAFALDSDPLTINMSDLDGVNLAAIKALDERTRRVVELETEMSALRRTVEAMDSSSRAKDRRIEALEARLARLEALLGSRR